jgi:hypothetical protein
MFNHYGTYLWFKAELYVDFGCAFLEYPESFDNILRHFISLSGNIEVLERSLRLRTPELVIGHIDGPECIIFHSKIHLERYE